MATHLADLNWYRGWLLAVTHHLPAADATITVTYDFDGSLRVAHHNSAHHTLRQLPISVAANHPFTEADLLRLAGDDATHLVSHHATLVEFGAAADFINHLSHRRRNPGIPLTRNELRMWSHVERRSTLPASVQAAKRDALHTHVAAAVPITRVSFEQRGRLWACAELLPLERTRGRGGDYPEAQHIAAVDVVDTLTLTGRDIRAPRTATELYEAAALHLTARGWRVADAATFQNTWDTFDNTPDSVIVRTCGTESNMLLVWPHVITGNIIVALAPRHIHPDGAYRNGIAAACDADGVTSDHLPLIAELASSHTRTALTDHTVATITHTALTLTP
jgi:hypothetical protein